MMKLDRVLIVNLLLLGLAVTSVSVAITIYMDETQVFIWTIDPPADGELKSLTVNFNSIPGVKFYDKVTYLITASNCSDLDNALVINVYVPPKTLTVKIVSTPVNHTVFQVDLIVDSSPEWSQGTKVLSVSLDAPVQSITLSKAGTYIFDLQVTFRSEGITEDTTVQPEINYQVSG